DVETAAVECRSNPRMLVNPEFVEKFAATPEKLLMLVMHELHHVLLGHTRLFPCVTAVDNLVFDAVINALLCRMFPGPEHTGFFTDFYSQDAFPACLLRPAAGWLPGSQRPLPPDPIAGRSLSNLLRDSALRPERKVTNRAMLRGLLRRVGGVERGGGRNRVLEPAQMTVDSPVPPFDRRAVVLRSLGANPLL